MEEVFWKYKCSEPNCTFGCMAQKILDNHIIEHQRIKERIAKKIALTDEDE